MATDEKKLPAGLTVEQGIRNGKPVERFLTSDGYRYVNRNRARDHQVAVNKRKGKT